MEHSEIFQKKKHSICHGCVPKGACLSWLIVCFSVVSLQAGTVVERLPGTIQKLFQTNRYEAIRRLGEMPDPCCRTLLLEIALGQHGASGRSYAATLYVRSLDDPRDAAKLLRLHHPDSDRTPRQKFIDNKILNTALAALRGTAVDADLWRRIKPLLEQGDWSLRLDCLHLLRVDSSDQLGESKLRVVLNSLDWVWRQDKLRKPFDSAVSSRALFFSACLRLLADARPINLDLLRRWENPLTDIQRKCLVLARALRGDARTQAEYRQIMAEDADAELRWVATLHFHRIAKDDDLDLLRRLAETDPYAVEVPQERLKQPGMEWAIKQGGRIYLVRQAARKVIGRLSRANAAKPSERVP
jgi:hypothetical protein